MEELSGSRSIPPSHQSHDRRSNSVANWADYSADSPGKGQDTDKEGDLFDVSGFPEAGDDYNSADTRFATMEQPEPQPAFAPSSTPLDLPRRFMCWNHIGSITFIEGEAGLSQSNIGIDFTDSAFRRPIHFTDKMDFILGSLGEDGGIFATDLPGVDIDDDDTDSGDVVEPAGSTIYFRRFETVGSLRGDDWLLTLPDGERVLGCASGEGWAAAMTRYVEIKSTFSSLSQSSHIISLLPAVAFSTFFRRVVTKETLFASMANQ